MPKTVKEVDDLKANWRGDPWWDIYDTPGFEAHRDELKAYQEKMQATWEGERKERIRTKARNLQCSIELAEYITSLERRINDMSQALETVWFRD